MLSLLHLLVRVNIDDNAANVVALIIHIYFLFAAKLRLLDVDVLHPSCFDVLPTIVFRHLDILISGLVFGLLSGLIDFPKFLFVVNICDVCQMGQYCLYYLVLALLTELWIINIQLMSKRVGRALLLFPSHNCY